MTHPIQFIVNERGEKIAAVISVEAYEKILEKLGNPAAIRAFKESLASKKIDAGLE